MAGLLLELHYGFFTSTVFGSNKKIESYGNLNVGRNSSTEGVLS